MNIFENNIQDWLRKNLEWLRYFNGTRIQEKQQVQDQQPYMLVSVAYPTYPSNI